RALLANNARLLVLPGCRHANLISRFMRLMLGRLSADWERRWGHPIALVETFVDPTLHRGTAYKVSGWVQLGQTAGWKRDADDFYLRHGTPKQVWVRELARKACAKLRAPQLPPTWATVEQSVRPKCTFHVEPILSLMAMLQGQIAEFRRPQALGYPVAGLLSLMVMAMATGVRYGAEDLADYADTLSQGQLRALGFRRDRHSGRYRAPKRTTFQRVMEAVYAPALETVLLRWQEQVLGPSQDPLVIVDGKKLRHGGRELVNMVDGQGRFLGSALTPDKTNEVPVARQMLARMDLEEKLVLADALHTCKQTAQQIHLEQGGDYLLTVKPNHHELHQELGKLFTEQPLSPSGHATDPCPNPGEELRSAGDPSLGLPGSDAHPGGLPRGAVGGELGEADPSGRGLACRAGVPDQQS
ncbi:MAG: ISAs1 family transposase, partial [Planctomycetes bacterium]|nr:ISAs1 family transposase [Planctomycetota bacterium]